MSSVIQMPPPDTETCTAAVLEAQQKAVDLGRRQVHLESALADCKDGCCTGRCNPKQLAKLEREKVTLDCEAIVAQRELEAWQQRLRQAVERERKAALNEALSTLDAKRQAFLELIRSACDTLGAWHQAAAQARELLSQGRDPFGGEWRHEQTHVIEATRLIGEKEIYTGVWMDSRDAVLVEVFVDYPPRCRPMRQR